MVNEFRYNMYIPLFIYSVVPVIYPASGEVRNGVRRHIASVLLRCPSGVWGGFKRQ
ncbi:MAG: hypothetical protein E5299_00055 [Burkholderia gladioli]|nr:MAG: hypothetical protein E5299_00055 [Burkholderia gladioli]